MSDLDDEVFMALSTMHATDKTILKAVQLLIKLAIEQAHEIEKLKELLNK